MGSQRRWAARSVRPFLPWALAAAGAVALFLGWYGVSGQSLTAEQLPYLASGGLVGVALVGAAAAVFAGDEVGRRLGRLDAVEQKVDELHRLLVEPPEDGPAVTTPDRAVVALPKGSSYHRPSCALVKGKPDLATVDASIVRRRSLTACGVCDPPAPRS